MNYDKFKSFEEMMRQKVIPLRRNNPLWQRVDGDKGESGVKIFALFEYNNSIWRVNNDTRFSELEKAFNLIQKGLDPFVKKKTKKGYCLALIKEFAKKPKHLYIYFVKELKST